MWKKKVEAGILLYALLMAAVFSLLLQFYLNRQVSSQRLQLFNRERTEAYAMAVLTKATAKDDSGEMEFEQGKAAYRKDCLLYTSRRKCEKNKIKIYLVCDNSGCFGCYPVVHPHGQYS